MDRRGYHRPLLSRTGSLLAGLLLTAGWLAAAGAARAQQPGGATPPPPAVAPTPDVMIRRRAAERMAERRQRELAADPETQRRIDQLPPEEREAFKRNLRVWRQLTPEERDAVRREAGDRTKAEVERAYQQSGLHLDKDQREVFGLRYRQERRKLERALHEKMEAERARQLPALVEGLKREFADKSISATAAPTPAATILAPVPAGQPTPSVSVPAAPLGH